MDGMVLKTQQWLNQNYQGKLGYNIIPETGITGWTTIYGLLHALQIELGITNTANNFGPTTISKFTARFPNGIQEQNYPSNVEDNIYGIIQGALWCKGYSTGASEITKHFYGGTGSGIISMKKAANCKDKTSTVTLNVMKALMSMTQFEKVSGGSDLIRKAQQEMNYGYEAYIGLSPCDGIYSRDMNRAMIKVLQAIEGFSVEEATGNFGARTKAKLPIVPNVGLISEETEKKAIKLVRYALVCNGYNVSIDSDSWDTALGNAIEEFQGGMKIEQIRVCNVDTWMALLLSTGNPDRACIACDTRFEMTQKRIDYLKSNGYKIVGRYLTGGNFKELRENEAELIIKNEMLLFLIFQESGTNLAYFTAEQGALDAKKAVNAARKKNIPGTNVIYFAVDTDPTDAQIQQYIIPYFRAITNTIDMNYYVGVYGTRNVCTQLMNLGYARSCFVSDMSTGFSGNMGFKMPRGWGLDQFHEIKNIYVEGEEENMDLDKDAYAGLLLQDGDIAVQPVDEVYPNIEEFIDDVMRVEDCYLDFCRENNMPISTRNMAVGTVDFIRSFHYDRLYFNLVLGNPNYEFINYVKQKNKTVYERIEKYSKGNKAVVDNYGGFIDFGHLACTVMGYLLKDKIAVNPYWIGWAGDLAELMTEVDKKYDGLMTRLEIANRLIGTKSEFGFLDMCSDADAIALSNFIEEQIKQSPTNRPITIVNIYSYAISSYYQRSNSAKYRMENYVEDLECTLNYNSIVSATNTAMTSGLEDFIINAVIGTMPSADSQIACYSAFADYIINNYNSNL